jgi:hypothetical protein
MRWFCAPPWRVAYFSSARRPGNVFRVSSRVQVALPMLACLVLELVLAFAVHGDALARLPQVVGQFL